jgi:PadR family transcriptional regulator, regulatory protein PadR
MTRPPTDLLRGTLDLLILQSLAAAAMHGWSIGNQIQHKSREVLQVGQGSLYPALQRLEQRGWIDSEWRSTEQNRRAKYYTLTATGRRALSAETENWRRYVQAVDLILEGG